MTVSVFIQVFLLITALIINRVLAAVLLWVNKGWQIRKDYSYQPSVSVLIPCFNEGRIVYDTIKSVVDGRYPQHLIEVIAVDDCSTDDSYRWIKKAAADFPNVKAFQTPVNTGGKDGASMFGFQYCSGEILIWTDSDTLFDENTVRELVVPMADPKIGATAGSVRVCNQNESWLTAFQAYTYFLTFELSKTPQNICRTVAVCSGAMLTIRRSILLDIKKELEERHWFGLPVHDGEDRFITHRVILRGYGTYLNTDAKCWTNAPATITQYFKQQLRWRRSGLRDFFFTLRTLPRHFHLHPSVLYGYFFLPLTTWLGLLGILSFVLMGSSPISGLLPVMIFFGEAAIAALLLNHYDRSHKIANPLKLAMAATIWVLNTMFVTILALFTLDQTGWGTRDLAPVVSEKMETT